MLIFAGWINSIRLNLQGIPKDGLVGLPIILLIGGFLMFLIKKLKTIEFDETSLYIKSRQKTTTIPFEKIKSIKMIMIEINGANFYKIEYLSESNDLDSVRLLPNNLFGQFISLVKQKNPNLKIKNWATSLDLDI